MRIEILPIHYSCNGCFRQLSINCWYVGMYPLTYTIQECAEAYCELVGWKLIRVYKEDGDMESYSMRVEVSVGENSSRTVHDNYYDTTDLGSL